MPVAGLEYDSRRVGTGFLFFAFPGARADGRGFAAAGGRTRRGRRGERIAARPTDLPGNWIEVEHGRQALALAARNFYRQARTSASRSPASPAPTARPPPSYLIDSILRAAGKTTALIGTIEYRLGGRVLPAVNTTPESLDLFRLFAELEQRGGTHATMEVSSHALALGRVYGIHFHTAVFTNLTRDHLDFHRTMEEYFAAKRLLFAGAGAPRAAVRRAESRRRVRRADPAAAAARKCSGTGSARTRPCARGTFRRASTACASRCTHGRHGFTIESAAGGADQRV